MENGDALKIVYTAMHGVGWRVTEDLFKAVGLPKPFTVDEQLLPDGNFPTVAFPNPEEPGAMDLAFAKAREVGANLVLANDPDADR
jgi:phosphomannomutase